MYLRCLAEPESSVNVLAHGLSRDLLIVGVWTEGDKRTELELQHLPLPLPACQPCVSSQLPACLSTL